MLFQGNKIHPQGEYSSLYFHDVREQQQINPNTMKQASVHTNQ